MKENLFRIFKKKRYCDADLGPYPSFKVKNKVGVNRKVNHFNIKLENNNFIDFLYNLFPFIRDSHTQLYKRFLANRMRFSIIAMTKKRNFFRIIRILF